MTCRILFSLLVLLTFNQQLKAQATILTENGERLQNSPLPLNSPYEKTQEAAMPILAYDHIRQADVFWEKRVWRVIDVREKMNKSFSYPQNPLISILLRGIQNGEVTAYDAIDDKFSTPINHADIEQQLFQSDTISTYDPDTYEETLTVVQNDFNPEDVKRFRIKEVWFFDEETSTLKVRILGIAPLKEDYDDNGNLRFEYPMFWVHYPHIRQYLATEVAFNPVNEAHPLNWEHLMEARFFASTIVKASNVHDRRIEDYKSGTDALYEALKIEEEILNFEHDLWSF